MEETNNETIITTTVAEPTEQPRQESTYERNLVAMRKKLEEEEKARKDADRRAEEAERRAGPAEVQRGGGDQSSQEDNEDLGLDPEDYMQNKQYQKANKKIHGKLSATEQKLAAMEQKLAYFEAKVETSEIKDFDAVVTDENIRTFARLYPDDHEAVMSNPNFKLRAKTMYNMIKNYGVSSAPTTTEVDEKLAKNKLKPGNSSSTSPQSPQTPLTRLGDYERRVMSDGDRDRIMKEVERKRMLG